VASVIKLSHEPFPGHVAAHRVDVGRRGNLKHPQPEQYPERRAESVPRHHRSEADEIREALQITAKSAPDNAFRYFVKVATTDKPPGDGDTADWDSAGFMDVDGGDQ